MSMSNKYHPYIVAPTALPRQRLFNASNSLSLTSSINSNNGKVKRNYVIEFEEKLQRLFQIKYFHVMRNAFVKLLPYQIVSPSLRQNFEQLGLTDKDISSLECVIKVSNVVENFKEKILEGEYEEFNDSLLSVTETVLELTAFKHRYDQLLQSSQNSVKQYVLPALAGSSPAKRVRSPTPDRSSVPRLRSASEDERLDNSSADDVDKSNTKEKIVSMNTSPSPASKSLSKSPRRSSKPAEIPEITILLEHQDKLTKHIESLEEQVLFLKRKKKQEETKHHQTVEKLVRQLQGLNSLLVKSKDEKESLQQETDEKNRNLEIALIHLSTAQEEIKRLVDEKEYHKSFSANDTQKINELIQKHSKYSTQQFTKMATQVDALRVELSKERSERFQEKIRYDEESSLSKKKMSMLETMVKSLEDQLSSLSVNHDGSMTTILNQSTFISSKLFEKEDELLLSERRGRREEDKSNMTISERIKLEQEKTAKLFDRQHLSRDLPSLSSTTSMNIAHSSVSRLIGASSKESKFSSRLAGSGSGRAINSSPSTANKLLVQSNHGSTTSSRNTTPQKGGKGKKCSQKEDRSTSPNKLKTNQSRMSKRMKELSGLKVSPENQNKFLIGPIHVDREEDSHNDEFDVYQTRDDYYSHPSDYSLATALPLDADLRPLSPGTRHENISKIMSNLDSVIDNLRHPTSSNAGNLSLEHSSLNRSPSSPMVTKQSPSRDKRDFENRNSASHSPVRLSSVPVLSAERDLKPILRSPSQDTSERRGRSMTPTRRSRVSFDSIEEEFKVPTELKTLPNLTIDTGTSPIHFQSNVTPRSRSASPGRSLTLGSNTNLRSAATSPVHWSNRSAATSPLHFSSFQAETPSPRLKELDSRHISTSPLPREIYYEDVEIQTNPGPLPPPSFEVQLISKLDFEMANKLSKQETTISRGEREKRKGKSYNDEKDDDYNQDELNESSSTIGFHDLASPRLHHQSGRVDKDHDVLVVDGLSHHPTDYKLFLLPNYQNLESTTVSAHLTQGLSTEADYPYTLASFRSPKNRASSFDAADSPTSPLPRLRRSPTRGKYPVFCSVEIVDEIVKRYNDVITDYNSLVKQTYHNYKEHEKVKDEFREEIQQSVAMIHDLQCQMHDLLLNHANSGSTEVQLEYSTTYEEATTQTSPRAVKKSPSKSVPSLEQLSQPLTQTSPIRSSSSVLAGLTSPRKSLSPIRSFSSPVRPLSTAASNSPAVHVRTTSSSTLLSPPSTSPHVNKSKNSSASIATSPIAVSRVKMDVGEQTEEFHLFYPEVNFPPSTLKEDLFPFLQQSLFTSSTSVSSSFYGKNIDLSTIPPTNVILQSLESMLLLCKTEIYNLQASVTHTRSTIDSSTLPNAASTDYKVMMSVTKFQEFLQLLINMKNILQLQYQKQSDAILHLNQNKEIIESKHSYLQDLLEEKTQSIRTLQDSLQSLQVSHLTKEEREKKEREEYEDKLFQLEKELVRTKQQLLTSTSVATASVTSAKLSGLLALTKSDSVDDRHSLSYSTSSANPKRSTSPLHGKQSSVSFQGADLNSKNKEKSQHHLPPPHPNSTVRREERPEEDEVEEDDEDNSSFSSSVVVIVDDLRKHPSEKNMKPNPQSIHLFQSMESIPTPTKKKSVAATSPATSPALSSRKKSSSQLRISTTDINEDENDIVKRGRKSPRKKKDDDQIATEDEEEIMLTSVPSLSKFQDDLKHISKSITKIQRTASSVKAENESKFKNQRAEEEEEESESGDKRPEVNSMASTPLAKNPHYRYGDSQAVNQSMDETTANQRLSSVRKSAEGALPLPLPQSNSSFLAENSLSPSRAAPLQAPTTSLLQELEEKLLREQRKSSLLLEQVQSMPVSLTVAQAEKRVLEGKLSKASEAYEYNIQKIQQHAVQKIKEVESFLQMEKSEKNELQAQLKEQTETIHQLTHHVKILQASMVNQQQLNNINLSMTGFRSPEHTAGNTSFDTTVGVTASGHPVSHSITDIPAMRRTFGATMTSGATVSYDVSSTRKEKHENGVNLSILKTPANIATVTAGHPSAVELEIPPPPWERSSLPLSHNAGVRMSGAGITSSVTPSASLNRR